MTKEQERAALAKIEKIVNEAGKDSYIGITFDGMIALCEENITNDWGCNPINKASQLTKELEEAQKDIKALVSQNDDLKEQMKTISGALKAAQAKNEELKTTYSEMSDNLNEYAGIIKGKDATIIELKAKLYDLMTQ